MKNIALRLITTLLVFILLSSVFSVNIVRAGETGGEGSSYNEKLGDLIKGDWQDKTEASNKASGILTTIVVGVKIVAVAVAIIMLLTVAMKYMIASPGERADIKKSAVIYVVGAFILFGVTGIITLIQKFASVLNPSE